MNLHTEIASGPSTEPRESVFTEQVRLLYADSLRGNIVHACVPTVLAFVLRDAVPLWWSAALLAYFYVLVGVRFWLNRRFLGADDRIEGAARWARRFTVCTCMIGIGWAGIALVYTPNVSLAHQMFIAMILGGMASGAMVTLSSHLSTYIAYVVPQMGPAILVYLMQGNEIAVFAAVLAIILTAFLIASARRANGTLKSEIALRHRTQALLQAVSAEKSEMDRLNTSLTREIAEHRETAARLQHALERAEAASRAKSSFLASMSHELRTPLNAITGYAQLFRGLDGPAFHQKRDQYAAEILRSGEQLLALITQVLELSHIDGRGAAFEREPIDVADIARESIAMIGQSAAQKGIAIELDIAGEPLPPLMADRVRLRQVLVNLLSNAVKYNRVGGRIDVRVAPLDGSALAIEVEDTGEGIAEDRLGQLFEPFNRLGREAGRIEGSGIGLTIAKQLVERFGGTIGCRSTIGVGTVFRIELPIGAAERDTGGHSPGQPLLA